MSASPAYANSTAAKRDHRQEVTDSIIAMLEKGVAPWQKPWEVAAMPFNPTTERSYRGGNAVHLMATALSRGYPVDRELCQLPLLAACTYKEQVRGTRARPVQRRYISTI